MIIDVHRHLVVAGTVQGDYIRGSSKSFSRMYNLSNKTNLSPREYVEQVMRPETDPEANNIVEEMDKAGVDVSVIFGVDYGLAFGESKMHMFDQNKHYAQVAQKHPGRFIPLIAIDPRRKGAVGHAEEAYQEWGMKGFKLHAGVGYMPDDPVCYWIYEKAAQWKVPIMCHTGGAPAVALRWENSRPAYFASAAAKYPEVDFIFAHCGDLGWWQEAAQAAAWLPNVYVDLSLWQKPFRKMPPARFYEWLRNLVDLVGADKIMFATDAPHPNTHVRLKEWVKVFTEAKTDLVFTKEEIDLIMGGTAQKVFKLENK